MERDPHPLCPECGSEVEFGNTACPSCGQELSWPGQEGQQGSFARPGQEFLGCLLVPFASMSFAAFLALLLAGAFAFFGGRYGPLVFGLAAVWFITSWLKRRAEEEEEQGERE